MKTVLVPTDFSECAIVGVNVAASIADKTNCPIVLHHNVNSLVNWNRLSESEKMNYPAIYGKTVEAERKLNNVMNGELDSNLTVNKLITHGITFEEIVSWAKQLHADMIIMGSHGNEGTDRYFIGSNVQKVIREATCPVLAANHEFPRKEIKKIIFPSNFNEDVHKPFEEVRKLAGALGATIYLLFVNTPEKFKDSLTINDEMNAFAEHYPDQRFIMATYDHQDTVTGILEYYEQIDADMIATITHDRRHSAKYLIGITEALVFYSNIPVLSVNAKPFEPKIT